MNCDGRSLCMYATLRTPQGRVADDTHYYSSASSERLRTMTTADDTLVGLDDEHTGTWRPSQKWVLNELATIPTPRP